ncbi:MAG: hypothetical protein AB8G15_20260 [Saprospiraceae bacterium]
MNFQKTQLIFLIGIFLTMLSCTNQSSNLEKQSQAKLEKVLKLAENTVKVMGQSRSGVDLKNENFDSLSTQIIRSLSLSSNEARVAYLSSEECLRKKRLSLDQAAVSSNHPDWQKQVQDSVYHSLLKETVLRIDSEANQRSSDPTIQDLLIEVEQLKSLKGELDLFCN